MLEFNKFCGLDWKKWKRDGLNKTFYRGDIRVEVEQFEVECCHLVQEIKKARIARSNSR